MNIEKNKFCGSSMILGLNIKRFRRENQLTQEGLGIIAGLSQSYVCELERGAKENPTIYGLGAIAKALNVTIGELVGVDL